ncbi:MAG: hypothetical protein IKU89_00700 [Oscillospiraceae bacterium]|nr:hypothetical protein [Oscillospiraceae bacterium]
MLYEICRRLRNFFVKSVVSGEFTIQNGLLSNCDFLTNGEYFRIQGSSLNDGVYCYPPTGLADEVFEGKITKMSPPPEFLKLVAEIEKLANGENYKSESFGDYSYTVDNQYALKEIGRRLNAYRKI